MPNSSSSESTGTSRELEGSTFDAPNAMTLKLLFEQLRNIRRSVHIPLIIMGYLNPIMQFGFEQFCRQCSNLHSFINLQI